MRRLADALAPRPVHEQRRGFYVHGANFHVALGEAERLGMDEHFVALLQSLATYAQKVRNFATAEELSHRLAKSEAARGDPKGKLARITNWA